jgi:predicted secreted protein
MSKIILNQNDRGKTVTAGMGDLIVIQLSENPSTGYRWEIDSVNATIIDLIDSTFSQVLGTGIGGGGTRTFVFTIRSIGTSKVSLSLRREWEPETMTVDRFEVIIHVT